MKNQALFSSKDILKIIKTNMSSPAIFVWHFKGVVCDIEFFTSD